MAQWYDKHIIDQLFAEGKELEFHYSNTVPDWAGILPCVVKGQTYIRIQAVGNNVARTRCAVCYYNMANMKHNISRAVLGTALTRDREYVIVFAK